MGHQRCTHLSFGHSSEGSIKAMHLLSSPSFTQPFFPTRIRDGGRREPREPRPCSLGRKNACHGLAALGIPRELQESPVRGSNGGALDCNAEPTLPGFCAGVSRPVES